LGTLFINYWANTGNIEGKTVGQVSQQYDNLFTPAGYAFSIWGFIYLWLLSFVGYQWYLWYTDKNHEIIRKTGIWLMIANLANALWVIAWLHEDIGLSVVIMLILLGSLVQLVLRLNLERWDAPLLVILFVWWPICWYIGWIILATVSNIAAYLTSIGWHGEPFPEATWTLIMIIIATFIYLMLIYKRNMREAALVGVWGLIAIAYKQWELHPGIVYTALGTAGILLLTTGYHGYKNRDTSPLVKWKNREF
jgi:hypothetical protein